MPYNWDAPIVIRDIRNGEWFWVQKEILASKLINASDKLVYSALAYYAHNRTQKCFPSYTKMAELTGVSRPTVVKALKALVEHGFVSVKKKGGKVNLYKLLKVASKNSLPVKKKHRTSKNKVPALVKKRHTNNTNITRLNNNKGKSLLKKRLQVLGLK